ncbi:MAG: hypothetical protein K9M03_01905 [Kiritimatiellales bacterium]|nr:hypothetical protein [Kiritimatiellales bacterium]
MLHRIFTIGIPITILSSLSASAFALTIPQNSGFLDQEKPDWIEAAVIPPEIYPTLVETIRAANLITHEKSRLHITSPTYEQAHRLLLQNLLMMQRQLHFNPEALAKFQSRTHMARSTVDPRIYSPNPLGIDLKTYLPNTIVVTGSADAYHSYAGGKPSRRSIVKTSETRNIMRVSQR